MALSSATQHAMPAEFSGKWGTGKYLMATKYLKIKFPLLVMGEGYEMKLKKHTINVKSDFKEHYFENHNLTMRD